MNLKIYGDIKFTGDPKIDSFLAQKAWFDAARPKQIPNLMRDEFAYLYLCGRAFGKTATGAHTVRDVAFKYPGCRIGVFAPVATMAQGICFEGDSGLLNCIPPSCIKKANRRPLEIELVEELGGAIIQGFSAEEPDRARGYQYSFVWADEMASWDKAQDTLDMITFGLRLPLPIKTKMIITTTPTPTELIYKMADDPKYIKVFGSTYENETNVDPQYIQEIKSRYEGTELGRQELYGELLKDDKTTIFKAEWFKLWKKGNDWPKFSYVVQSWDTAYTMKTSSDPCAVTTWGVFVDFESNQHGLFLIDAWQAHMDYPTLKSAVQTEFATGKGPGGKIFTTMTVIEGGSSASGAILIQDLGEMGIPLIPVLTGGKDKVTRASLVSWLAEKGKVYLPEDPNKPGEILPSLVPWYKEVTRFSGRKEALKSQKDNFVDSTTHAWKFILDSGFMRGEIDWFRESKQLIATHRERKNPYVF